MDKENIYIYIYIYIYIKYIYVAHIYYMCSSYILNMAKECTIVCIHIYIHVKRANMSFAGKCLELVIIMVSEISQAQKEKYCVFSVTCGL
jgi:hypothetical protein